MAEYLDKSGLARVWSKIKGFLNTKVDKVAGKGLSTEDYTTAEREKLAGIVDASATAKGLMSSTDFKKINPQTIAEGTDLDTIKDLGWYKCTGSIIAETLVNCPTSAAFVLEVYKHSTTYQRISTHQNPPKQYARGYVAGTATWNPWFEWKLTDTTYPNASATQDGIMSATDFKKINTQIIENGTDLNDVIDIGWYSCSTSANIGTLINKPVGGVRMFMEVMGTGGASRYQHIVIQRTGGATQFEHYHRIRYSSSGTVTWQDWVKWELTDTTYTNATTTDAGLMSAVDFNKINTTEIAENTDLDTLTDIGWYMSNTSTVTATLTNCPTTSAFALEVYDNGKNSSGTGKYQHIATYANPPKHYSRRIQVNGTAGTWQEWKLTDTKADWNEADTTSDAYIQNKPFTVMSKTITTNDYHTDATDTAKCLVANCLMTKLPSTDGLKDFYIEIGTYHNGNFVIELLYEKHITNEIYGGTVNWDTGEITITWVAVDLGGLSWSLSSYSTEDKHIFYTGDVNDRRIGTNAQGVYGICEGGYNFYGNGSATGITNNMADKDFGYRSSTDTIYFRDDAYTTAADFKTAIAGTYLVYELATPQVTFTTPTHIRTCKGITGIVNPGHPNDYEYEIEYITEAFQPLANALGR